MYVTYKFTSTDNGNCRIYYRQSRRVFCFQEDKPGAFTFYQCSRDGEPEYKVHVAYPLDRNPDDDSATARSFREWIKNQELPK